MNIIILCIEESRAVGTTNDHLEAFKRYSENTVLTVDARIGIVRELDFSLFDCLVVHHSVPIGFKGGVHPLIVEKIKGFSGPKLLFIQDEMRWVTETCARIMDLGINVVFTVVNEEVTRKIYGAKWFDNVRFEHVLTGYVPENLINLEVPEYSERRTDVSYRARKLPGWCGSFGQEKYVIAERFSRDAESFGLTCDISCREKDRIYGKSWIRFVSNSKAMLGAESGASFIDFSGEVAPAVENYESKNPQASFEEIREKFLQGRDREITISVISPRCFEAAALRTLMIMYEGNYSGVLRAWEHYVPLKRDHSNMKEIVDIINDPVRAKQITSAAYRDVCLSGKWSYQSMIERFDSVVFDEMQKFGKLPKNNIDNEFLVALISKCTRQARLNAYKYKVAVALSRSFSFCVDFVTSFLPRRVAEKVRFSAVSLIGPVKRLLKRMLLG